MIRFEANTPRRFGIGGDQVRHDVQPCGCLTVGYLVSDQLQTRIFGRNLLFEALGAFVQ